MALEGGYNLRSIANSVFACAKVLLGDKFTFSSPEMQPFESTWRIIQAVMVYMCYCCLALYFLWTSIVMLCLLNFHIDQVRNELKTYWPVLSSKLPENLSLRIKPSSTEVYFPVLIFIPGDFQGLGALFGSRIMNCAFMPVQPQDYELCFGVNDVYLLAVIKLYFLFLVT